ncbi:MAG: acyl-CoA dehydrogenase family protein [Micrococcales bacterium]|nr:acyl-CoA dehydrogenase family protein [Micrococcales bacterium]
MNELLELTDDIATRELAPQAAAHEREARFPRQAFRTLGRAGLLGLPYSQRWGGAEVGYEDYLQVLEKLAQRWLTVALGVSVHTLSCHALATAGSDEQRDRWLPDMLGGERLGAYCLSEPQSGSDAAGLTTTATRDGEDYLIKGVKAWITHGGVADFYTVMTRTSPDRTAGITAFLVPADAQGLSAAIPERKMGMRGSVTAQVLLDDVRIDAGRRLGEEGSGFKIALNALDSGRLGIAACAVGLAQAALDVAVEYAGQREQFGAPIATFQGVSFTLADMATGIAAGRALYLDAARRRDAGQPFSTQAAMAKLFCTDMAMSVTTSAVQVLGGAGYVEDYPVERYMREAKVLQIVEGTNEIQRLVIGRALTT